MAGPNHAERWVVSDLAAQKPRPYPTDVELVYSQRAPPPLPSHNCRRCRRARSAIKTDWLLRAPRVSTLQHNTRTSDISLKTIMALPMMCTTDAFYRIVSRNPPTSSKDAVDVLSYPLRGLRRGRYCIRIQVCPKYMICTFCDVVSTSNTSLYIFDSKQNHYTKERENTYACT